MPLTIRHAVPADVALIVEMNARMAHETEELTLDLVVLRSGVAKVLADPSRGLYFLAEQDGRVVGQTMVTFEWSDWRDGWFWWFSSVYVMAESRRQGVFRALYQHVIDEARGAGDVIGLRLYVERENGTAQQTYKSLGMTETCYNILEQCPL